jgi:hypothetical protein
MASTKLLKVGSIVKLHNWEGEGPRAILLVKDITINTMCGITTLVLRTDVGHINLPITYDDETIHVTKEFEILYENN